MSPICLYRVASHVLAMFYAHVLRDWAWLCAHIHMMTFI